MGPPAGVLLEFMERDVGDDFPLAADGRVNEGAEEIAAEGLCVLDTAPSPLITTVGACAMAPVDAKTASTAMTVERAQPKDVRTQCI